MSVLNHSPRIVNDGLILCLDAASIRSYSGSGAEWSDLSGSDFDATITGATWRHHGDASDLYKTGAPVFDFDGSDDEVNNSKKPSAGLLGASYCFWIRLDDWMGAGGAYKQFYCEESTIWIANYEDKIGFDVNNGSAWVDSNGGVNDGLQITVPDSNQTNTWLYVVMVFAGNSGSSSANFKGYLDGEVNFNVTTSFSSGVAQVRSNGDVMEIGHRDDGGAGTFLNGQIGSVKIYNKALTAQEVRQNYEAHKPRFNK